MKRVWPPAVAVCQHCCSSIADGISRAGMLIESGSQESPLLPDADMAGSWFRVGNPIHGL